MIKRILFLSALLLLGWVTSSQAALLDLDSESTTLLLLGVGLASLAGFARKKIKN
jgi:hypothetical protein